MADWCDACPDCPGQFRAIGGDGPRPADLLIVMERPGDTENRRGRVACGKTGQELDETYLKAAGLRRRDVRVVNAVLCGAQANRTPSADEARRCAAFHLPDELARTRPSAVILCGATACSLCPGIALERHHGIPQHTGKVGSLLGWSGWVVPFYHPAMGLHESRWMTAMLADWMGLSTEFAHPGDRRRPKTDYRIADRSLVECLFAGVPGPVAASVDTESHGSAPWSLQVSLGPGTAILVPAGDTEAVAAVGRYLPAVETVFHNAQYDIETLRRMGVRPGVYRDTMQEAYQLGDLPQGLKSLVYRLFRVEMDSYEDTVKPASVQALTEWLTEAWIIAGIDLQYEYRTKLKTKFRSDFKPSPAESLLKRLLRHTEPDSEYDPWERLDEFWADQTNSWMTEHIESRLGHYPLLGIANCRLEDAVRYAAGDADWTGQVAIALEDRRQSGQFRVPIEDADE